MRNREPIIMELTSESLEVVGGWFEARRPYIQEGVAPTEGEIEDFIEMAAQALLDFAAHARTLGRAEGAEKCRDKVREAAPRSHVSAMTCARIAAQYRAELEGKDG